MTDCVPSRSDVSRSAETTADTDFMGFPELPGEPLCPPGKTTANSDWLLPQLRYLQTLNNISVEKNSTIIFPVPVRRRRSTNKAEGNTQKKEL